MPLWGIDSQEYPERIFDEQLRRLGTEYIDFYLLHALESSNWPGVKEYAVMDFLEKKRAQGKLRYIGFSFHDSPELFREIAESYPWDFCQIQLNYVDWKKQRAGEIYKFIEEKNIPLVVMEPVRGGDLANPAGEIKSIFKQAAPEKSLASWALRYVASLPQVRVVLSGMSTIEQVADNLSTFNDFRPLSHAEREVIDRALAAAEGMPHNRVHRLRLLHALPRGRRDTRQFQNFQRLPEVPQPREFPLQCRNDGRSRLCIELCRLRGLHDKMPAAHRDTGRAQKGR
jgi:predicted aldo/keto reductase-like oxidoreductase